MLACALLLALPQVDTPVLWACQAEHLFQGSYALLHAGYDVSMGGDFDGDGRRDLLLGGMNPWDRSPADLGGVLLFSAPFPAQRRGEVSPQARLLLRGGRGGERFGWSAALVGAATSPWVRRGPMRAGCRGTWPAKAPCGTSAAAFTSICPATCPSRATGRWSPGRCWAGSAPA
jgi:hypothetical protein